LIKIDNAVICTLIKDTISSIKDERCPEAIISLNSIQSSFLDKEEKQDIADLIKTGVQSLQARKSWVALHLMQIVIILQVVKNW
jgi:hypothetical protein